MDAKVVKKMGRKLRKFITEFDDCFARREPRDHLRTYVVGQLSDLPRKSVEPIALAAGVPPRTLQRFLSDVLWDHERLCDKTQWKKYKIKDGEKGPVVWEVKAATFYRKHGEKGLPDREHTLIVARNVVNTDEVKYFLSNMVIGSGETTLSKLLWTAFSRWPVERCFEIGKRELGMDHFETRSWQGIHRHFYISQLSQLFCARVQHDLREKNFGESVFDSRTSSAGYINVAYRPTSAFRRSQNTLSETESRSGNHLSSKTQPRGPQIPHTSNLETIARQTYKYQTVRDVYTT
jgi:SRSO17 transposase